MFFEKSTIIHSPIHEVFSLVVDLEKAPHVHTSVITKTEQLTEGAIGLGTRWRKYYSYWGMRGHFDLEIVEWQPYKQAIFHGSDLGIVTPHFSIHFQEKEGGTEVRYVISPTIHTPMLKWIFPIFAEPYGKRDLNQYFQQLQIIFARDA